MNPTEKKLKNFGSRPVVLPASMPTTHRVFGTPNPANLPDSFDVGDVVGPVDQGNTAFCSCYTTRELCSDIDKVAYDENWNVAMTSKISGEPIIGGTDPMTAMNAMVDFGALLPSDAPAGFTWQQKSPEFIADSNNWPADLFLKSAPHEQVGVFSINGPYDAFDNIRSQIFQHKRSCAMATQWFPSFNEANEQGLVPPFSPEDPYSWHMYTAKGWIQVNGQPMLKVKPYEGAGYGAAGYAYFNRDTVNKLAAVAGTAFLMFADIPSSVVSRLSIQNLSLEEIFAEIEARIKSSL